MLRSRTNAASHVAVFALAAGLFAALGTCAFGYGDGFEPVAVDSNRVEAGIQRIRELKLKRQVPLHHRTRAQVAQTMLSEIEKTPTEQNRDAAEATAGSMLGRYHRTTDANADSVKMFLSQVAAFYDHRKKEMVILETPRHAAEEFGFRFVTSEDFRDSMVLAHELTHALQDQDLGMGAHMESISDNSDALLAFKSLVEGDATLAGFAYVRGGMDDTLADFITAHFNDLPQIKAAREKNVPDFLSVPFIFQYAQGCAFVREAYRRGGWDAVDAAFRNPPESSQQIIDPTLYFDRMTRPLQIRLAGYQKSLPGWSKVLEDSYGELALRLILQNSFGRDSSQVDIAQRWTGDRMVVLSRARDYTVIWMVAFNDEQGAALFADFYRQVLDRVDGPKNLQGILDQVNGPTPHDLEQVGNRVLVVVGPGAVKFHNLAPEIWMASQVVDPNPTAPEFPDTDRPNVLMRALEYARSSLHDWLLGSQAHRDPLKYYRY